MTKLQKLQVIEAIRREIDTLGSASRVANKLGISKATLSNILNRKWDRISTELWNRVASALHVSFGSWQVHPEVSNTRMLMNLFGKARQHALFVPVSYYAGSGKSQAAKYYISEHPGEAVYYLNSREWARREFLTNLMRVLGIEPPKGVVTVDQLGELVIRFFQERAQWKPLLILDEADKLKPSALRWLIHLFNATEDKLAVVIMGTENLEKEIKRGVRLAKKGYDEIDSRFGRNYIRLMGATRSDVAKICEANGITEKEVQARIFKEAGPVQKRLPDGSFAQVVEDLRRVKRIVQRELMRRELETVATV